MAIGTILRAVLKTSWMSAGVKSRIERTSRPRKLDIESLIRRFDLKQSADGRMERESAAQPPAAGLFLRVSPPQLGDVRGKDYDSALGFHVPLPVFRVLQGLLGALHGDRRDDLSNDVVDVDAEDLAEQVLHPVAIHGERDHPKRPYLRKLSTVSVLRGRARPSDDGRLAALSTRPRRGSEPAGPPLLVARIKEAGRGVLGPACGLWRRGYWVGYCTGRLGSTTSTALQSPPKSFVIPVASWNRTRRRPFSKKMYAFLSWDMYSEMRLPFCVRARSVHRMRPARSSEWILR